MAQWAKPIIYYDTMLGSAGSTLTATSTATGKYDVDYLHNWLEKDLWKAANTTTPMYITYDAGAGNTKQADYLAIFRHNLNTIGATITLQYSTDNFVADVNDAFTAEAPSADTVYLKEFTDPGAKRYWRLKITGTLSAAPYMGICVWGLKTELDYATASFDPDEQEDHANVKLSGGGYPTGIHNKYIERRLRLRFDDVSVSDPLYDKIKTMRKVHGLNQVFIAWDKTNNPSDIFLMLPGTHFYNPFKEGGAYRDITLDYRGRME